MRTHYKTVLAVLAGVLLGAAGAKVIRAQQAKPLPAYVISELEVTDPATFQKYSDKAPGTLMASGGRYVVRGGKTVSLEGEPPKRIVVVAFDSVEKAQAWEDSPAYEAIKPLRHSSAKARVYIV